MKLFHSLPNNIHIIKDFFLRNIFSDIFHRCTRQDISLINYFSSIFSGYFWHITDLHLDWAYSTKGDVAKSKYNLFAFIDYDISFDLNISLIYFMTTISKGD